MNDDLKPPRVGELTLPRWQYWLARYNGVLSEKSDRIEKLEAALRGIIGALNDPKGGQHIYDMRNASYIARKALEGKDD